MFYSGTPRRPTLVPAALLAFATADVAVPIWENEEGGLTFSIGADLDRGAGLFVKWAPVCSVLDLVAEASRLEWAAAFTPVPIVVDQGSDAEGSWFVTKALAGRSAVSGRWRAEPATAVRAIGEGLRALHDSMPVASCPFSWAPGDRIAQAEVKTRQGRQNPARWCEEHRHLTVAEALTVVAEPPPVDRAVVCHGDACAPNTLIGSDGRWCADVDFERMGVADRWADLAIAAWSTTLNYGPGWEPELLAAYGIAPDPERSSYYRLLWDLS